MAAESLGRVSIVPQGDYDENRVYKRLDLVRDNGKTYLSLKEDNTSVLSDVYSWMLITESGRFEDLTPEELDDILQPLNDATEAANMAAQNAIIATNGANDAANIANNAKGWQPLLVADATTIIGKTLLKLQDWIGGTGTKPTTNVGQWQTADGTYTSIASEANDIRGSSSEANVILDHTISSNVVIQPISLNLDTGIFTTATPHGLSPGQDIFLNFNNNVSPSYAVAPYELQSATYGTPFIPKVHSTPTDTTFTIRNTQLNSILLYNLNGTANTSVDVSKFHFEVLTPFSITGLNIDECTIRLGIISPAHSQGEIQVNGTIFLRFAPSSPFNYMTYLIHLQRINGVLQGFYTGTGSTSRTSPTPANFGANIASNTIQPTNLFPTFGGQSNAQMNTLSFNVTRGSFLNGTKITILR